MKLLADMMDLFGDASGFVRAGVSQLGFHAAALGDVRRDAVEPFDLIAVHAERGRDGEPFFGAILRDKRCLDVGIRCAGKKLAEEMAFNNFLIGGRHQVREGIHRDIFVAEAAEFADVWICECELAFLIGAEDGFGRILHEPPVPLLGLPERAIDLHSQRNVARGNRQQVADRDILRVEPLRFFDERRLRAIVLIRGDSALDDLRIPGEKQLGALVGKSLRQPLADQLPSREGHECSALGIDILEHEIDNLFGCRGVVFFAFPDGSQ